MIESLVSFLSLQMHIQLTCNNLIEKKNTKYLLKLPNKPIRNRELITGSPMNTIVYDF